MLRILSKLEIGRYALCSFWRDPLAGTESEEILIHAGVEGVAQRDVIFVFQRDEAEWLQNPVFRLARWLQNFGHGFHGAGCRLDGDLDQIALFQSPGQSQHATGLGNGLQFRPCAPPIIKLDHDGNCASELNSLGPVLRMCLGEVCHSQNHYVMTIERKADYGSTCPDSSPGGA
jgi:hypothetical protein